MRILLILLYLHNLCNFARTDDLRRYNPDWDELDARPLPRWYDEAKIGIFIHWGVYSVPSFGSEWFWTKWNKTVDKYVTFMEENYPPNFTYQEFAPMFTAEFFGPNEWAELFAASGAKYVVLTSKHHEGYTLFPSKRSFSWNSVEVGPKRDIVGDLANAVRKQGLKFGVYHSLLEWFNPIYEEDAKTNFTSQVYVDTKLWPDIKQLVNDYKPSVLWADGDWDTYDTYWRSRELLAWLYNDSPVKDEIVVNDRLGIGTQGKHGDFYNYADRFNNGTLLKHKWENAFTIDSNSWGYRRNMMLNAVLTSRQILFEVVSTVSCGGNVLINIGPTKEGTIAPIFQERLINLGKWLEINGESIYSTSPWVAQNDTHNQFVWYTCRKENYTDLDPPSTPKEDEEIKSVYVIFLKWPRDNVLKVKSLSPYLDANKSKFELLDNKGTFLKWHIRNDTTEIELPNKTTVRSEHAWVLRVTSR